MKQFDALINRTVERLFLIIWPPEGEAKRADVDISIGFVFVGSSNSLCVVSTNKNDAWSPCVRYQPIPRQIFDWPSFDSRIEKWMNSSMEDDMVEEYYEVTNAEMFGGIVSRSMSKVEFVGLKGDENPFGVRMTFENDYILSTPISDGNTIETSKFNRSNNVSVFEELGVIEWRQR